MSALRFLLSTNPDHTLIGQLREQFRNGLALPRQTEVRRDLCEWPQDKLAQVSTWMRQAQHGSISHFICKRDQVQIQWPRFVQDDFRSPTKMCLQRLQLLQKSLRSFFRKGRKNHRRVYKIGRTRRTIHRRAPPE